MTAGRHIERRQVPHTGLVLEPSFLFRISPRIAWPTVILLLCGLGLADMVLSSRIWLGPAYLAVLALTAWALSSRTAIALGLLVLTCKIASGTLIFYPVGAHPADLATVFANIAVRIGGIAVVIGFIGLARKSCEREWHSARTDLLTGALNRQAFFEIMESDKGSGGWSAIIYADLDGLKKLNDEEGHAQGDRSLKAFADTVRRTVRKGDVFARLGGDEFAIFMKLKDEDAGTAVAGRLHRAINVEGPESAARLKCSLGILLLPDGSKSIDAELRVADELMYKAKQSRSGVVVSKACEIDGEIGLTAPVFLFGPNERGAQIRQMERPAEAPPPEPRTKRQPRAAA